MNYLRKMMIMLCLKIILTHTSKVKYSVNFFFFNSNYFSVRVLTTPPMYRILYRSSSSSSSSYFSLFLFLYFRLSWCAVFVSKSSFLALYDTYHRGREWKVKRQLQHTLLRAMHYRPWFSVHILPFCIKKDWWLLKNLTRGNVTFVSG